MDVLRDLLDKSVVDANGREMGRVDGIALESRSGRPARLSAILIGPTVLGHRLHPSVGRWIAAIGRRLGVDRGWQTSIPFKDVREIAREIRIDAPIGQTDAGFVEQRLRQWLIRIPGA